MNNYPDKIEIMRQQHQAAEEDYEIASQKLKIGCAANAKMLAGTSATENEVLRVCQALLLSTCVLLLSYHGIVHGMSEFSVLENGRIVQGYKSRAVVTFNVGYSVPYSSISFLAIGMLAYSLVSKNPRWSLPSIALHLPNLVYDISAVTVAIWLFFGNLSLPTAASYATASVTLILADVWTWLGVLKLYEQRTFK